MDRKIVDYVLCEERESYYNNRAKVEIDEKVVKCIKNGFQPFGSPFIKSDNNICQAMVKYEEENVKGSGEPASKLLKLYGIVKSISTELRPDDELQELDDLFAANYVNRILEICNEEVSE